LLRRTRRRVAERHDYRRLFRSKGCSECRKTLDMSLGKAEVEMQIAAFDIA
jgi:hypothetical protein